ncbi:protein claret segregational [Diorhabda sublineata]|uniref:protein claret segregational n=1 Tax=Diorhabda sublineata TaxID=1163346 RepID=UPI0024E17DFA|nr:protein claret segregational [Diorhabda sublineata]
MDKSKLPKPSKLRQPLPVPLIDLKQYSRLNLAKSAVPKERPQFSQAKLPRRSKSMTNLKLNMPLPSTSTLKPGVKRPATTKADNEVKSKVVRQQKVPDWDYKTRFQLLSDKHKTLQEVHSKLKADCADSEKMRENFESTISEYLQRISELEQETEKLKNSNNELNANNIELLKELDANKIKFLEELESNKMKLTEEIRKLTEQNRLLQVSLDEKKIEYDELQQLAIKMRNDHLINEKFRRRLHNTIQDLKGNIRVFCRVRPPINELENEKIKCWINYPDENTLEIKNTKEYINPVVGKVTDTKMEFTFDQVFNENATQSQFFEELSQLVQSAIDGYNVCVFAYGQTGSGKTFTMQGASDPENLGMIPRSVNLIFDTIENLKQYNWKYEVRVSFLEIYNENIRDLLDPDTNQNLDILYNEGRGTTVTNLKIEPISTYEDFEYYMKLAQKHRMVAATDFNEHSSRSHAITKIYLSGKDEDCNTHYTGSINLVDLAGSESGKTSKGARLVETKSINKSLSALGSVMLALHNKDKHIPYRNSKLTYLLQSSLGGNSKTLMIVNISPFEETYSESINSLRFASKVKEVKTKIKKNKTNINEVTV